MQDTLSFSVRADEFGLELSPALSTAYSNRSYPFKVLTVCNYACEKEICHSLQQIQIGKYMRNNIGYLQFFHVHLFLTSHIWKS
jgi:hypothetical protein